MSEDTRPNTEAQGEAPEGTDESQKVTAEEDPVAEAVKAALEAERERLAQEVQSKVRSEYEGKRRADEQRQREEAQLQALSGAFGETLRSVRNNLKSMKTKDDYGDEKPLFTDAQIEEMVVQPLQRYNLVSRQAANYEVLSQLGQAALSTLPEDARDEFIEKASGKPFTEWLETLSEYMAPKSAYAKKVKADLDAAVKVAEAKGFDRGRKAPQTAPTGADGKTIPSTPKFDLNTASGLARAFHAGQIDEAEFNKRWAKL